MARSGTIYIGDSAIIEADLFLTDEGQPEFPTTVSWEFVDPSGIYLVTDSLPDTPTTDQVVVLNTAVSPWSQWDAVQWDGAAWIYSSSATNTVENNVATLVLPGAATQQSGIYTGLVRFTIGTVRRSHPINFEVTNAFEVTDATSSDPATQVVDRAWMKFSDLFDSEFGGPWLKDVTFTSFNKQKMARLLPDALYGINNTFQPATGYDSTNFPYDNHSPLLTQALLVETIIHLMRSYVEQPNPLSGNVSYLDRRDYLQRWQTMLEFELKKLNEWIDLFKRDQMGFGQTSILVGGYSGWYGRHPRYMRGRFPYIYRYF